MKNNSWTLTAKVKTDGEKTNGVIMGCGGAAGIVLYVKDGIPTFDYNYFEKHTVLNGAKPLLEGEATVKVDFDYQGEKSGGPAALALKVNGETVVEGKMDATVGGRFGIDTFGIGEESGQPVTFAYKAPFKFTGEIEEVMIEVK
jgi:hypothetical protein